VRDYPFFPTVPLDYAENLRWRLRVREKAEHDKALQQQLIRMCRDDLLFFLAGFVWLYEPRPRKDAQGRPLPTVIPFIPWKHQIPAIKLIDEALGYEDIAAEKSRGEGMSWIAIMTVLHRWLFQDTAAFGLVSRNELTVDNPDDPDSLMWKLDWELSKLPPWMAGELGKDYTRNVSKHVLRNIRNGSTITGYAATGDVASGGRKTAFVLDELSKFPRGPDQEALDSTGPVTESRLIIATPKGADGAYYNLIHSDAAMVRITLDWKDNPSRNRGMFLMKKNRNLPKGIEIVPVRREEFGEPDPKWVAEFLEKDLKRLSDRGFATTDELKWWSPWYVKQCLRPGSNPHSVAQEYDRDYGGSVARFFNAPMIDRLIVEGTKPPKYVGDLQFESTALSRAKFVPNTTGSLKIWCHLMQDQYPAKTTEYVIGADVALGQGGTMTSNSVLTVVDRMSGTKVAEFASPVTPPEALANYAIALACFFAGRSGQAFLIWEDNGAGSMFRNRVFETTFRNFYYRAVTDETSRRRSKKPGWTTQRKSKRELLGAYAYALGEGLFINPSRIALSECKEYMIMANGRIEHVAAENTDDPTGAGENHGDRVIADALANWVLYEAREGRREAPTPLEVRKDRVPPTSILAIRNEMRAKDQKKEKW